MKPPPALPSIDRTPVPWLALACALLVAWLLSVGSSLATDPHDAIAWYDTLGFPNVKDLPYVRVTTGGWKPVGSDAPGGDFVEGFLLREEGSGAFVVFLCSVSQFKNEFDPFERWYPPLSIARFVRRPDGPTRSNGTIYRGITYEAEDFTKVASDALVRVRDRAAHSRSGPDWGDPLAHQARIFAFARSCEQKGLAETASALLEIAANIPDRRTGQADPGKLCGNLQEQIGAAVLSRAESDFGDTSLSWADLLKPYEGFDTRYPASPRVAYAREAAALLRQEIAEDAAHHPKPTPQMSPAEQAAEAIYQLRNLHDYMWTMYTHYPGVARSPDGKEMVSPVERLVDLGDTAIPLLIEALDDRHFTRELEQSFHAQFPPADLRVGDVAQRILEHVSGQNLFALEKNGKLIHGTTRQQAEAWWAEKQHKGERQQLVEKTARGGTEGRDAARLLVEKYPDVALAAIEAGVRATTATSPPDNENLPSDIRAENVQGTRGEYVEIAGKLPGETPVAFLQTQLAPDNGLYSQVHAAEALFTRHHPEAVPAMITAWHAVQPRLRMQAAVAAKQEANQGRVDPDQPQTGDAYGEVGGLITFLARSADPVAIDALRQEARKAPVAVRLALVQTFWPGMREGGESAFGISVRVQADLPNLSSGAAGRAVERLLVAALDDTDQRLHLAGNYDQVSYKDPRICDMAALVLSRRWPEKCHFDWVADLPKCDSQIATMRARFLLEKGSPPDRN